MQLAATLLSFSRTFTTCMLIAALVWVIGPAAKLARGAERAARPNLIVIMADDLGAAELACYGNEKHRTPHLDQLAQEGTRYQTCYATPICTSTRVLIMTGQYGFRTGYFNFLKRANSPRPDSPQYDIGQNTTFADLLKAQGYATCCVGKWQLTGEIPNLVHDCGFEEYRIWTWLHELPEGVKHTGGWQSRGVPSRFWHPGILENDKYLPTEPGDYGPQMFTDYAKNFIRRHKDQPFCLYYPMALTHTPWDPTPDLEQPGEKTKGGLKHNVEAMDHMVGQIVRTVDELGLAENTIILFTGDNGTEGAGKGSVTEMGARVPLIVRCPGKVPAGVVSDELSDLSDVLPTLVDFAGAKVPDELTTDGVSLVPGLLNKEGPRRDWAFSYLSDQRLLRDKRWLLEGDGRFYDCGSSRNGAGYKNVTDSADPEVLAARARFAKILEDLPGPEGHPGLVSTKKGKQRKK